VCRVSFSLRFALGLKFGYLYSDAKIIKNDKIQNKNARKNRGECDVSLFFDDNMGFVERNGRFVDVGTPQQASPYTDQLLTGNGWLHISWNPFGKPRNYVRVGYYK
jgi:hypothetical protein